MAAEFAGHTGSSIDDAIAWPFSTVGDLPMVRDRLVTVGDPESISVLTVSEDMAWAPAPLVGEPGQQL